jgi:Rrf2 family protein
VPRVFLTKIVAQLASHGMLRTQRGKGGGVMLGRAPEAINLLEVIETFEGSLQFNQCAHDPKFCVLSNGCIIRGFWRTAERHLKEFFRVRTLSDLLIAISKAEADESEGITPTFEGSEDLRMMPTQSAEMNRHQPTV